MTKTTPTPLLALLVAAAIAMSAGCGSETNTGADSATSASDAAQTSGLRLLPVAQADAVLAERPDDLIVLDVRTPEEFAAGHLRGAEMIDFYRSDFADQIAALDRDAPYVIYCRSGNRSGQALELMSSLGFTDVVDVEGGIQAWAKSGYEVVQPGQE